MLQAPKILIVDDEPRMRESMGTLLGTLGLEIESAQSGQEALARLSLFDFELALLDIGLPDMSGYDLMDRMKAQSPDLPFIVITGDSSLESALGALKRGAYDYLRKPFEPDELLRTVQNALNQRKLGAEKEEIRKKLIQSEEKYRYLVQNSPDIIYTLDAEGRFTFVSDSAAFLLGYQPEELLGKHYSVLVHHEDKEKVRWHFNERRTLDRATSGMEVRVKARERGVNLRPSEPRYFVIDLKSTGIYDKPSHQKDKEFLGTHGVIRDITERKKLEAQLHHAERLEALGTLSGGVAHDFNNLLMGIQGNLHLLMSETPPSHRHFEKMKAIEHCVQSGASLAKQLLGFARGGKYELRATNMNDLIQKTSDLFGRTRREITVFKDFEEGLWAVEVDRDQMEQVLLNLYVNAWQAMIEGGELHLITKNENLDQDQAKIYGLKAGKYVEVSVRDTGTGMDEGILKHIFEPFFTTKERGRGTGLGLASAYGIVRSHGGIIEARSKVGRGSTFVIYLPASEKPVHRDVQPSSSLLRGSETILLVDDETAILEVSKEMLESLGYQVVTAATGKEAVETYQKLGHTVDLVILDMIMPGMGGARTFDSLKSLNPDVKVLLSSGYSIDGEARDILERGCKGFIQKPYSAMAFSQRIREILEEGKNEN
jgi:two-component system cell cycle sensor histidine kinase/response regulator CckA